MEKIYANSEEKYLKAVVLYAIDSDDDTFLCYDAEGTQPAYNTDYDWKDLFLKGLIRVNYNGVFVNPYMYGPIVNSVGLTFYIGEDDKNMVFPTSPSEDENNEAPSVTPNIPGGGSSNS